MHGWRGYMTSISMVKVRISKSFSVPPSLLLIYHASCTILQINNGNIPFLMGIGSPRSPINKWCIAIVTYIRQYSPTRNRLYPNPHKKIQPSRERGLRHAFYYQPYRPPGPSPTLSDSGSVKKIMAGQSRHFLCFFCWCLCRASCGFLTDRIVSTIAYVSYSLSMVHHMVGTIHSRERDVCCIVWYLCKFPSAHRARM